MISSNIIADAGQDVAPSYLPDGRILFSSTRQRQAKAILIDEGKSQFEAATEARNESAFVLHVMNADGTDIHQISFNPSSDLYGQVLQNGRILFTRWDRAPGRDGLHLYTSNPDGTDMQLHYGALSHLTGTPVAGINTFVEFMRAREMSDGRIMVLTRQRTNVDFGGNLTIINANSFVENSADHSRGSRDLRRRAESRYAERRAHDSRPLTWRPLQLGLSALGRLGPHSRELDAVPPARHGRSDAHRALHFRSARQS